MENGIMDLYCLPDIQDYEDVDLLALRKACTEMEEKLGSVMKRIPEKDAQLLRCYMQMRDLLEYETVKTALRWGKRNYK